MNKGYGKHAVVRTMAGALCCAAALTGCAGSAEPSADGRPAAGPRPLTQAALNVRALSPGEAVGPYRTGEFTVSGGPLSDRYSATPPVCQPLVGLTSVRGGPVAQVHRRLGDPAKPQGVDVAVQLRSYGAGRAAAVMEELRTAGAECRDGFAERRGATAGGAVTATYTAVRKLPAPAGLGDEAQAYRLTLHDVRDAGRTTYEYLTVLRDGASLLSFRAEALAAADPGGVPKDVLDAQWEKWSTTNGQRGYGRGRVADSRP
ncbi:hypothetical protein [Streptomyces candidus]|uniref:Lipoprotein n=1 Tax=Streptomyces candidus TaxID=67283 RepID=A0A7X0HIP7_9ACTN|nr:hypothetical protein [Streptomyces candidus]MBB6438407.1 hypothetical protein [Streptomyces candidus]GHH52322.1 hypothetical protein GCM10018773_52120 [Streptomyces candidus]